MKRWLAFVVPFALVAALGLGWIAWQARAAPCHSWTPVDFADLDPSTRCVEVEGTASYEVVISQELAGNGFFPDRTYAVFPLLARGNTQQREVRVLVRTERPPERFVTYEDMTVRGRLLPLDGRKVPPDARRALSARSEYWFADRVLLLEPEQIEVDGASRWVAP